MAKKDGKTKMPSRAYHYVLKEEVEVVSPGHFPTTVVVRSSAGKEFETDRDMLDLITH